MGADDVLARLASGTPGLPSDEAARRVHVVGPNTIRSHRVHALSVLASQLRSPQLMLLAVKPQIWREAVKDVVPHLEPLPDRLLAQDRHARFEVGWLDIGDQPHLEAAPQPVLEGGDGLG